jgi:hypothetical protein
VTSRPAGQLTQNRRRPGQWKRYRRRLTFRATPTHSIYVRVRDRATNRSRWRQVTRLAD